MTIENSNNTFVKRACLITVTNFAFFIYVVIFQDRQLYLLYLVLIFLRSGLGLLHPFISTITKSQTVMKDGCCLSGSPGWAESFLILDLGLCTLWCVGTQPCAPWSSSWDPHEKLHLGSSSMADGKQESSLRYFGYRMYSVCRASGPSEFSLLMPT